MSGLHEVARPGLMLSQTWPDSRSREFDTLRALERAMKEEFFSSYQTVEIPSGEERKRFARLISDADVAYTYCLARALNEGRLNLSALDERTRVESCERVLRGLDEAREAGADTVTVVSGAAPPTAIERRDSLASLRQSMGEISQAARAHPAVRLAIEPLDVMAHKKMSLGYTREAIDLCVSLRADGLDSYLCIDSAHMLLNDEDPLVDFEAAAPYTVEFHYCNPVVDSSSPLFGDRHIRFGPPGVLSVRGIARMMERQLQIGYFSATSWPSVMCEVLNERGQSSEATMSYCRAVLSDAWDACVAAAPTRG